MATASYFFDTLRRRRHYVIVFAIAIEPRRLSSQQP